MTGLTDATVRALKPPQTGQKLYRDSALGGFGVRVSQGGTKSFVVVQGKECRMTTIGQFPVITLAQARTEAKRLMAERVLGKVRPQTIRYEHAVDLFLADKAQNRRPATVADYKRRLGRLGFKGALADITPDEAARKVNKLTAPSERSHTLVAGKVFFEWCRKRRYIDHNPLYGLSKPDHTPRKRVLSDDELRRVWNATDAMSQGDHITRLLLVTGQRMTEVERWLPGFLTGDLLTVPETVTKNGYEQLLPLGPLALQLLSTFPGRYTSWGAYKAALDERTGINEPWMLRDLRRTFRTNLSKLGVQPHVAERLLHHITGTGNEVQRTYDRFAYIEEMREAMLKWEAHLSALCGIDGSVHRPVPFPSR